MEARIIRTSTWRALAVVAGLMAALVTAASAWASPFDPSGVVRIVTPRHLRLGASKSTNWFGYDKGSLANGGMLFNAISATWSVPVARQHTRGQAEDSATWIGIGGGCIDASCHQTDPSGLIQTGTEQDVDASGRADYSAWWELVPAPAVTISDMTIRPHDRMRASISELTPGLFLWRITLEDLTRGEAFTSTLLYPSSRATAEWIEETPTTIGTGGVGVASLPRLSRTLFRDAAVNGAGAALKRSEQIQLVEGSRVIGAPSAPNSHGRGFNACSWTSRCRRR